MAILRKGNPDRVCIHHSAVSPGANNITELKARAKVYDIAHSKKTWANTIKTNGEYGYKFIEYHYMVAKDGTLLQTQADKYVLYHAGDIGRGKDSFNLHGVAVLIDGDYMTEKPTQAQTDTVVKFIKDFQKRYKIDAVVRGHKETSQTPTVCPGTNLGASKSGWIKNVINLVNAPEKPVVTPPVEPPKPPEVKPPEVIVPPEKPVEPPIVPPSNKPPQFLIDFISLIKKLLGLK